MISLGFIYLGSGVMLSTTGLMNAGESWGIIMLFIGYLPIVGGSYLIEKGFKQLINK